MIPPLVERCPECGHVGWARGFRAIEPGVLECPACHCRFERVADPRLT